MLLSSSVPLRTTYAFVLIATIIFYKMPFVKSHCDSQNHFVNHYSSQMSKLRLGTSQDPDFFVVVCLSVFLLMTGLRCKVGLPA